ncbi:MAG: hypothetical protein BZ135_08970 [Methanosphaera sp. rholeuAM6]|nr:MAG: hypothetical protein BZ135_08970 [Methanosphaera sp. rholeuAM6]
MKYSISREEFEKKVRERFIDLPSSQYNREDKKEILDEFLNGEGSNFMDMAYSSSGAIYSQNQNRESVSEEQLLETFILYPVRNLEMLLL